MYLLLLKNAASLYKQTVHKQHIQETTKYRHSTLNFNIWCNDQQNSGDFLFIVVQ